jgi:hypothetical protein
MSGHGTAGRDEWIGLLGLEWGLGLEGRMVDRLATAGGGLRMNIEVRMGDSGVISGSWILELVVGELTDTALRGGKWLDSSDIVRGGTWIRIPSNLTRGESAVADNGDN